ncbi:MAG TPA: diguanylate cyclase [Candidatus Elarobacter sp.]|nr:diguanylate cyclase [Candidatus Elarobacter sp.]
MPYRRARVRYAVATAVAAMAFTSAAGATISAFHEIEARQANAAAIASAAEVERSAFVALVDEETGVRGYVATGDAAFLEPYWAGSARYAAYRSHGRPVPDRLAGAALSHFGARGDTLQRYFRDERVAVGRGDRAGALAALPAGKAEFDRLRAEDAGASDALRGALAVQGAAMSEAVRTARSAMVVIALVLIGVVAAAALIVRRENTMVLLARRDALTDLPNRRAFDEHLEGALARRRHEELAVLYVDLDGFKPVNDRLGHAAGDAVLAACGERLRSVLRPSDFIARLGGDEFAAIVTVDSADDAAAIASRIEAALDRPFAVHAETASLGASVGVVLVPHAGVTPREVLRAADDAMYRVKRGRTAGAAS